AEEIGIVPCGGWDRADCAMGVLHEGSDRGHSRATSLARFPQLPHVDPAMTGPAWSRMVAAAMLSPSPLRMKHAIVEGLTVPVATERRASCRHGFHPG